MGPSEQFIGFDELDRKVLEKFIPRGVVNTVVWYLGTSGQPKRCLGNSRACLAVLPIKIKGWASDRRSGQPPSPGERPISQQWVTQDPRTSRPSRTL